MKAGKNPDFFPVFPSFLFNRFIAICPAARALRFRVLRVFRGPPSLVSTGRKKPLTKPAAAGLLLRFSFHHPTAYDRPMSIEIKIRKNEPIDRALRRMKKKLDRENIIKGTRAKRYFEKPCEKRRRKEKVQAFTQMLRRRYAE
jgi:small subunit ribosomal protein S21